MNKYILTFAFVLVLGIGVVWWQSTSDPDVVVDVNGEDEDQSEVLPDHEAAELTAFGFMQDLIVAAPGLEDEDARARLYEVLSQRAKQEVARDTLMEDIAIFVGVQDVPDQGVSVENLEVHSDTETTLIVGLNYSGGRELRAIDMVVEDGVWKIDEVRILEAYPPEDEVVLPPDDSENGSGESEEVAHDGCFVGGCSGQVCSDDPDVITTCEWLEEYACYREATCERQADGQCGWTETETLLQCLDTTGASLQ